MRIYEKDLPARGYLKLKRRTMARQAPHTPSRVGTLHLASEGWQALLAVTFYAAISLEIG